MRNERDILMTDAEIARSFCSWPWVLNFMQMRNVHGFLNISQFFSELKYTFLGVKNSKVAKPHNVSNDADSITDFERLWCGRCVNAKHLLMASKKEKKKKKKERGNFYAFSWGWSRDIIYSPKKNKSLFHSLLLIKYFNVISRWSGGLSRKRDQAILFSVTNFFCNSVTFSFSS